MKNCGLFCAGWWPFLLLPLLLLLAFGLFQWRSVEEDVQSNSLQTIGQQNQNWAQAETHNRGRDLLIAGAAPSEQVRNSLEQELLATTGVRTVEFVGEVADSAETEVAAAPAVAVASGGSYDSSISAYWQNNMIVLRGQHLTQAGIDSIVANANSAYGAERVVNELSQRDEIRELNVSANVFNATATLEDGAKMFINSGGVTITGEVGSEQTKTQIGSSLLQSTNGVLINALSVDPTESVVVAEPVSVTENDLCKSRVDELLLSSKIVFATGKSTISPDSDALLRNIADVAGECIDANFEVAGHTDSQGAYDLNIQLSQARAQAVVDRLVELQLDANRFTVQGFGPDQPVADNESAEGRAQNRRIEFNLRN